jgi:hypothetical protein
MIANIHNESFGYSVACYDTWAAIGNPSLLRYNPETSSLTYTGSVEIYKYNISTDTHDLRTVIRKHPTVDEQILLAAQSASIDSSASLHTELTGSIPRTSDMDLLIDVGNYYTSSETCFGVSLDMCGTFLAVGIPYYTTTLTFATTSFTFTGSGVEIYDLNRLDIDPYAIRSTPSISGFGTSSGFITASIDVPSGQQYSYVLLESQTAFPTGSPWVLLNLVKVTNLGGTVTIRTNYSSIDGYNFRATGLVGTDPYLTTIPNASTISTGSFGYSVAINDSWLAVGSLMESSSKGVIYMYQKMSGAEPSWSLYQTINPPINIQDGDMFGRSISLNKATGSIYNGELVVGSSGVSGSKVYVYTCDGLSGSFWTHSFTLNPDNTTIYPLTFYPANPIFSTYPNFNDHFGWSVSMYKDTIMVGSPTDREVYEYTGSTLHSQGSVYFFERCLDKSKGYYLARKSYGNENILKHNRLGHSVAVYNNYAIAGSPKTNMYSMSICYLRGTLFQQHYCGADESNMVNGQYVLYQQTTGSITDSSNLDWDIVNVYQIKKRLLNPYRQFGYDVDISQQFITIGSPMMFNSDYRIMDMTPTTGSFTGSIYDLGDITGKAYIYNLRNLRETFYVGNVFYRNGKVVVMSSGSAFDGLLSSTVQNEDYEYDMSFKSKQTIYEKQVVCPVDIGEFNVSTNPTAVVLPTSSYDINNNGRFDFQDCDVLLRFMMYKATEPSGHPTTEWSSSILNTNTDEEQVVYTMYSSSFTGTDAMFTDNYSYMNNTLYNELDFNGDNKINTNDMSILWKYFINRLTQKNYETYLVANSERKYLSDIIDFLNNRTMRNKAPSINPNFSDYSRLSKIDQTGSYLAPYVTTIGLYSGCDLIAVAKLGSPIKITPDFPYNFIVKMDF